MNIPTPWQHFFKSAYYQFARLDSTQRYLREHVKTAHPIFCLAHQQHHGEGQQGRPWHSSASALTFSFRLTLEGSPSLYQGLTQAIALTLATTLDPKAQHLRLKWPNDLYYQQKKLAGILIDSQSTQTHTTLIIGIGLNLSDPTPNAQYAYWQHLNPQDTKDTLLNRLMPPLIQCLLCWQNTPYLPINHRWNDYSPPQPYPQTLAHQPQPMFILGIDQKGRLIAKSPQQPLQYLTQTRILPTLTD